MLFFDVQDLGSKWIHSYNTYNISNYVTNTHAYGITVTGSTEYLWMVK